MSRFVLKPLTALLLILKIFLAPPAVKTEEIKIYFKVLPETPLGLYKAFTDEVDDDGSLPYMQLFSFISNKSLHPNPTLESILHNDLIRSTVFDLSKQLNDLSPPGISHIAALAYVLKEPVLCLIRAVAMISVHLFKISQEPALSGNFDPFLPS